MAKRAAVVAFVLIACAAASFAAAGPGATFTPPLYWTREAAPPGIIGVWADLNAPGFHQTLVFRREAFLGSLSDFATQNLAKLPYSLSGLRVGANQSTTTCGGTPARYLSYAGMALGRPLLVEEMMVARGGFVYVLAYSRLFGQQSAPEARAALTSICLSAVASVKAKPPVVVGTPTPLPKPVRRPQTPTPFIPASAGPVTTSVPTAGPIATTEPTAGPVANPATTSPPQ